MHDRIKIQISSDTDYDELVAEIYINEKFMALVSQEDGDEVLQVEFAGREMNEVNVIRKIALGTLNNALEKVRAELAAFPKKKRDDAEV